MKLIKKLAVAFLCVCLTVPCLMMTVSAATEGTIELSDATVKVGEEFKVTATTAVDAGVGTVKFTVKYDPAVLEFVSGDNATKTVDGTVEYNCELNQNSLLRGYETSFTFKALKNGTTSIEVTNYDITSSFDINWTTHSSDVTVGTGTNDQTETEEPTTDDPATEEPTTDENQPVAGEGAEVVISSTTTITLINDVSNVELPDRYMETTVTMDGEEYAAWQDSENADMYILYGESSQGGKSLYRYDVKENTYQRFEVPEEKVTEAPLEELEGAFSGLDKRVVIGAAALLVLLVLLVIVLGVKLYNRNAELDEVYDDLDNALAENDQLKKNAVIVKEEVVSEPVEEESDDDDDEVEVEFFVEETVKEFFEEEAVTESVAEPVEKVVEEVVEEVPAETPVEPAKESKLEEFLDDDEDDFYKELDFSIDFIDLDD